MGHVISRDGTLVAYERTGRGPGLVLTDGALASRSAFPTAPGLASLIADRLTVVGYDRRGRGRSGPGNPAPAGGDVDGEIADLNGVLDTVDPPSAVCEFSSGAVLALRAAAAGSAIDRLVLYEPPFVVSDDRSPLAADYSDRLAVHLAGDRPDDAVAAFLTETVGVPAAHVESMWTAPHWAPMVDQAASLPYDAALMGLTMSGDPAELDVFALIDIPALVLYGEHSPAWLQAGAKRLADVLPAAELVEVSGEDHLVTANALAPLLRAFLTETPNP